MKRMMKMNLTEKKKLFERIEEKTGVLSTPTEVKEIDTLVSSGFPHQLYLQWKEHCNAVYNDIHWAKIWSDHLKAQAYDNLINSAVQAEAEPVIENENDNIPLIGDGGN